MHIRNLHGDKNWKCHLCPFNGKRNKILQRHLKEVHDKQSKDSCTKCGKWFYPNDIKAHELGWKMRNNFFPFLDRKSFWLLFM